MPLVDLQSVCPTSFPAAEDDTFEFKRSATRPDELKKKLDRAVSAFGNSGGGCFIYGLDGNGNADGGVSTSVGRQELRDWLDQVIAQVSPCPAYEIKLYDDCEGRGVLAPGNVIAAISILPSESGPHQASDCKYYIRAGAHTQPAGHYIVEALWARRHIQRPALRHVVRCKPSDHSVAQVGIVAVTSAPALDVCFSISPLYGKLTRHSKYFPIRLPVVDHDNPFYFDVGIMHCTDEELADDVRLSISYRDYAGNEYQYTNAAPLLDSLSPVSIGTEGAVKIAQALEKLSARLGKL